MWKKTLLGLAAGGAALCAASPAMAQTYFVGQVIIVGYNFCPVGTLQADGSLQSIATYQTLYTIYGTTYGGDGQTSFGLPDLRGRSPIHVGQSPGTSSYALGQQGGTDSVTLTIAQMPSHTHQAYALAVDGGPNTDDPNNAALADFDAGFPVYKQNAAPDAPMAAGTAVMQPMGGSNPFSNLDPFLTLNFCVVIDGVYPPPS